MPNATKVFLWRACCNILPTKANLKHRGVIEDATCILCNRAAETTAHALWHCPAAQDVWSSSVCSLQKSVCNEEGFLEILEFLSNRCNSKDLGIFACTARAIWYRRNEVTHGGCFKHPAVLAKEVDARWKSWEASMEHNEIMVGTAPNGGNSHIRWKAPAYDTYKVNWDVSVKADSRRFGVGLIVRDFMGQVCAACCSVQEGCPEPTVAEAMGALTAVEFCRDLGFQKIVLEGDSKSVVQAVNGGTPWCKFGQIMEDIHAILPGFRSWKAEHVRREANAAAHGLAKAAELNEIHKVWMEEVPDLILDVVNLERSAIVV